RGEETGDLFFISQDGKRLAFRGPHSVELWDAESGRKVGSVETGERRFLVVSQDGEHLAFSNRYRDSKTPPFAKLADFASPQDVVSLQVQPTEVTALSFSPDGRTLAVGHDQGDDDSSAKLELWDVTTRQKRADFEAKSAVEAIAFSPDSGKVASGGYRDPVSVRDVTSKKELCTLPDVNDNVSFLEFSPNGQTLAVRSRD